MKEERRRIIVCEEKEVRFQFHLGSKSATTLHLVSLLEDVHLAFKVQTTTPAQFSVKPPSGFIPPLARFPLSIVLRPLTAFPDCLPFTKDKFLISAIPVPPSLPVGGDNDDYGVVPPEWFPLNRSSPFRSITLRVMFVGGAVLRHLAASGGDPERFLRALRRSSDSSPRAVDPLNGRNALHIASTVGHSAIVRLLLDNPQARNQEGLVKEVALADKHVLDKGPVVITTTGIEDTHHKPTLLPIDEPDFVDARDNDGVTPLHIASAEGHIDCITMLMAAGANVDARDHHGATPLHHAAEKGHAHVVNTLVDFGANMEILNHKGRSPSYIAHEKGHIAIYGTIENGDALLQAAREGDVSKIEALLDNGASLNCGDQYGWTALHCAAFKGHKEVIRKLLERGASTQVQDKEGHTPLHCAVESGQKEVVQILVEHGQANVNAITYRGATPLYLATIMNHSSLSYYLESVGGVLPLPNGNMSKSDAFLHPNL